MDLITSIREFYDKHPFPGSYDISQIKDYQITSNKFLTIINQYIKDGIEVLDVGCGTGVVTNLFALKYNSNFTGIDFSKAALYAKDFANRNNITNVEFKKQDLFEHNPNKTYDVIICQSVLTHIPEYVKAIEKLKTLLSPTGVIIVSIYNPYGKIIKKIFNINYKNERLKLDQESNPYEVTFSHEQMLDMWNGYNLLQVSPSIKSKFIELLNFFNFRNGGLTAYVFQKNIINQQVENEMWDWIKNYIEVPHEFYDYKFPICPYAKSARLKGMLDVKAYNSGNFKKFITDNLRALIADEKHKICVLVMPPRTQWIFGIKRFINKLNAEFIPQGCYIQFGSAIGTNSKYPGIFNQGAYYVVFMNQINWVLDGNKELLKTDYYKNWSKKHYNSVVVRRQNLIDKYKDGNKKRCPLRKFKL